MDRTGTEAVKRLSAVIVGAGLLFAGFVTYQLQTGAWVATPPPRGFGFGGPNDGMQACLPDTARICPNAIELARIACVLEYRAQLSPPCLAALGDAPQP